MKILHTSDWHLGKRLKDKTRDEEYEAFISWLLDLIREKEIDLFCHAGDIFDSSTPSNKHLALLYNDFLAKLKDTPIKESFFIAGNHDSPTLLSNITGLLDQLNIHMIAKVDSSNPYFIYEKDKEKLAICPIPFIREKDIRPFLEKTDDPLQKEALFEKAIYDCIENILKITQKSIPKDIPLLVMSHQFIQGSVINNPNKPSLYVGGLGQIPTSLFKEYSIDYLALGHIHQLQKLSKNHLFYYCGAPLQFTFDEYNKEKYVLLVDIQSKKDIQVEKIPVPIFQKLEQITGDEKQILDTLETLDPLQKAFIKIIYNSEKRNPSLVHKIKDLIPHNAKYEILQIETPISTKVDKDLYLSLQDLKDLDEKKLFKDFLKQINITDKNLLKKYESLFAKIVTNLKEKEIE